MAGQTQTRSLKAPKPFGIEFGEPINLRVYKEILRSTKYHGTYGISLEDILAEEVIPKGRIVVTLAELRVDWISDAEFRMRLWEAGNVATRDLGLYTSGPHRITETAISIPTDHDKLSMVGNTFQYEWRYEGENPVVVASSDLFAGRFLVIGNAMLDQRVRIAHRPDPEVQVTSFT